MLRHLLRSCGVAGVLLGVCAVLRFGAACSEQPTAALPGSGFVLTPENAVLSALGDTVRFTPGGSDPGPAGAPIAWSSSDSSVAVVDSTGLVVAVANGAALITARRGASSDRAVVTVSQVPVRVAVLPANVVLSQIGESAHLTAVAYDGTDHLIPAAGVIWSSTDTTVAVVAPDGTVTARGNGAVMIEATAYRPQFAVRANRVR